ncbi:MAG: anthranilate phosphoribosyltransferase [Pseudomonadota bacterium]|nr:anthranilate phosphoribosyltransferase [Pseudomonadota bacterium]
MSSESSRKAAARQCLYACIDKIATGPEYSKNLSFDEAYAAMRYILAKQVDPVQSAVFLIALRMKRETDAENSGALRAIMDLTGTVTASADEVVDLADPYDGYTRCLPISPFLPAVLAACGVRAVSHGVETVAPKQGATHRKILRAAGMDVGLDTKQAAARVGDPNIGWAYVDQRAFCPGLHDLVGLRELIVKRPVFSTVENLTGPIRGRSCTHLVTGYVHKAYPPVYARLAREAGFTSIALIRGVEGGVLPSLRQSVRVYYYHDEGEMQVREFDPKDIGIQQSIRVLPPPEHVISCAHQANGADIDADALAQAAAEAGLETLGGAPGPARDGLVYASAIILMHLRRFEAMSQAADAVRAVLDSGSAYARFRSS